MQRAAGQVNDDVVLVSTARARLEMARPCGSKHDVQQAVRTQWIVDSVLCDVGLGVAEDKMRNNVNKREDDSNNNVKRDERTRLQSTVPLAPGAHAGHGPKDMAQYHHRQKQDGRPPICHRKLRRCLNPFKFKT